MAGWLLCMVLQARGLWGRIGGRDPSLLPGLLTDLAALSILLYFTGGSTNPFVSLLLLPIIAAAVSLEGSSRWILVAVGIASYTGLLFFYRPLPPSSPSSWAFAVHVWGMWAGFVVSAGSLTFFVARIGRDLRRRDRELAMARERALRADQVVALGALAAGSAHELGTPLATMAVLVGELQRELPGQRSELALLREQIDRCKGILARMAEDAGQVRAEAGRRVRVDRFLQSVLEEWRTRRPRVRVKLHWSGRQPVPEMVADASVGHALLAVLDNAADAYPEAVGVEASWSRQRLHIAVLDRGRGLTRSQREQLGRGVARVRATRRGMGLGLLIARASVERLGGQLRLQAREGGGVRAEIGLPLVPQPALPGG